MKAYDFVYDGINLSEKGFVICNFDSKGMQTVSNGCQITFNKSPIQWGSKHELTSVDYEDCLETTIQICKNLCSGDASEIYPHELRELTRWLNRKKFLKFKILDDYYYDLYFEASFNISRIEFNGILYGLELEVITNRPFALKEPVIIHINNTKEDVENSKKHSIFDVSHEEGYIYPYTKIKINESGDLNIYNELEDRSVSITDCEAGEIITMNNPIIESSNPNHIIQDSFNWNFFRVANTYSNRRNDLTISLPCEIRIEYSPIVKVGL